MLYEIREYVAMPGRLPALVRRFNEHTFRLFKKHEMELVQIGITTIGENSFDEVVYTMRFADLAEMEDKWARFMGDSEWATVFAESEADGPLVRTMRRRVLDGSSFGGSVRL